MNKIVESWHPGSFTKNFGWRHETNGLKQLHRAIRVGFANNRTQVSRDTFRDRLENAGINPYIPLNFFLFNLIEDGESVIVFDELAFQAVSFPHGLDFDRLALFAFNLSLAGRWKGARDYQSRPALWSNRYIVERLATFHRWRTEKVTADDIQAFIANDPRYRAQTSRKLATNLAYLYRLGGLDAIVADKVTRWWMNAAFLTADRVCLSGANIRLTVQSLNEAFLEYDFWKLSGTESHEKKYALRRLLEMYVAVGGPERFWRSADAIKTGTVNDARPYGLVDKKLPRAPKSLPAGVLNVVEWLNLSYDHIDQDRFEDFNADRYVRETTLKVLSALGERYSLPRMNAEDFMKLMRG